MPAQFPAVIELSELNGSNGIILNGIAENDQSGFSVAGIDDFNDDGVDDLIIGAPISNCVTSYHAGQIYVVFGGLDIGRSTNTIELSNLDGDNGFKINGKRVTWCGYSVSGNVDINVDGIKDLIIGGPNGPDSNQSGESYVLFGNSESRGSTLNLWGLNGKNGFEIPGRFGSGLGCSVSAAGDVNADGINDIIIGASSYDIPNGKKDVGQSYIIFGAANIGNSSTLSVSNLDGYDGFAITGVSGRSGHSVSGAGDLNADGVDDVIVGAFKADPNGVDSGQSYVIFGASNVGPANNGIKFSSLNGSNGFKINGIATNDYSGYSVSSVGDINNDGVDDVIIGAYRASPNGRTRAGQSYVIFGDSNIGNSGSFWLSGLDGLVGFTINGIAANDYSGIAVSGAGDINHDGIADLIIGASGVDRTVNVTNVGSSYLIFGASDIGSSGTFESSDLNGINGLIINGISMGDNCGRAVNAAGDINHDGVDDLIIGAYGADPGGRGAAGQSYVVYGDHIALGNNQLVITKAQTILFSANNLNATSINHNDALLHFQISHIEQGQFEFISNPNIAITSFYQQNITDNQVQFVHNGSDNPPSYEVNAFTDMWARTGPEAATINFTPILLVNNVLSIDQGGIQILSAANLYATDSFVPDNSLQFTIADLQHGRFEAVTIPGVPIIHFTQQKIMDQDIRFIQDNTPNVPSYSVIVGDGTYTLLPTAAMITFNYSPVLETNNLSIGQGQQLSLSPNNLKASDPETPAKELLFSISALQNGRFELASNAGVPISQFTQGQVDLGAVQFIHNGSPNAPSYNVTVSDNAITTAPNSAIINWNPTPASKADRTVRNTLLGTFLSVGVVGTLLLCYVSMGFLQKRRLKAAGQRGNEEQAHFYKTVIIPIAQAVFKQIKVTGFMNYISANQMEAYVAEIATVVNEINQLGIQIELQEMEPDHQTQLLNQIVKQMKRHLGIQSGMCNRTWFTTFFKPQVKPEMIGQKAKLIASSVHAALLGNPDNEFEEIEMPTVRLLAGDERRDSMNSNADDIIQSQAVENARLQGLLEERDSKIQQRDTEIERLRELLNQQASDGSFNSTTSYVKLA